MPSTRLRSRTILAGLALLIAQSAPARSYHQTPSYELDARVRPVPGIPATFVCEALLRDTATQTVLANPKLRFARGGIPARLTVGGLPAHDQLLEVTVAITATGEARYEARLLEGGETRAVSRVTFALESGQSSN